MRKKYHMPKVFIEEFSANAAVATSSCTSTTGYSYTFDCMAGPNADNGENVVATALSSGCTNNVSWFADYQKAVDLSKSSSGQHSNHNGGTWGAVDGHLSVTYSGAKGLLAFDCNTTNGSNPQTSYWSANSSGGYIQHSSSNGGMHHNVAPVSAYQYDNMTLGS